MNRLPLLTLLTFIPLAGGAITVVAGKEQLKVVRAFALGVSLLALAMTLYIWMAFDSSNGGLQFVEYRLWAPSLGIYYHLGVDGLGMLMLLLSALIVPFALRGSWNIEQNPSLYYSLILFLEAGLFGTFTAQNFVHWFIFWELSLIPAFFLIKLWGGPKRTKAALQFFIYTMAGSVAMLVAFLAIYARTGSFAFGTLPALIRSGALGAAAGPIFIAVLLGFAVKVPLFPFHTWLPDAYAEAPVGTSMILTGAMSKMGVYGFLRIVLPMFPEQMRELQTPLLWLAVATIVFSAAAAFAQEDLKRMVAYSSINHLGYCLLGIFAAAQITGVGEAWSNEKAAALNGVMLQMFNHGLTAAALFYFVGLIEERGRGVRGVQSFGGLRKKAPIFCGLMGITIFASLGLPGLNGFVGEFLIFKGTFSLAGWAAALSTLGLLLTAIFLLTALQKVFSGPLPDQWRGWPDLSTGQRWTLAPVIVLIFVLGLYPKILIDVVNPAVLAIVKQL